MNFADDMRISLTTMGLTCRLFILVALVTTTSAAPLEEIDRVLDDLIFLEELKEVLAEKKFVSDSIEIDPEIPEIFNEMKLRSAKKWCTFKIENNKKVVVDECGPPDYALMDDKDKEVWEELVSKLTTEPRYILYDISFTQKSDGRKIKKVIFVFWCPDNANVGHKLIYASSKDNFKKALSGLSFEHQGNNKQEMDYDDIKAKVEKKAK